MITRIFIALIHLLTRYHLLLLLLYIQEIIEIIDACNDLAEVLAPPAAVSTNNVSGIALSPSAPRVKSLSSLCQLEVNFSLDHLNLALLSEHVVQPNEAAKVAERILLLYASSLVERGKLSHAVQCCRVLAMERLRKLDYSEAESAAVLKNVRRHLARGGTTNASIYRRLL